MIARVNQRAHNELRPLKITPNYYKYAEGSCLIELGNTKVICAATVEERVPHFLKNTGKGWLTAEYGMLPKSSFTRIDREASKGKQSGRTHEIQRLIGRSLRSCLDLNKLGSRQIKIDCDVIEADGGTRTAAITGGYVALHLALTYLYNMGIIRDVPLKVEIAAISCGIVNGVPLLDLDYSEDSQAEVDANFILTSNSQIVELQTTAEKDFLKEDDLLVMLALANKGAKSLIAQQRIAVRESLNS